MVRPSAIAVGAVGGLVAAVGTWNRYQRVTTEEVPYTVVDRIDDVELRRYPPAVLAQTVAPSENAAFRRLFRYIDGANEASTDLAMTAPVNVEGRGESIPMTAPVEAERDDEGVRMAFFLPSEYDADSAPRPTDDAVDLVPVPERTLAVRRFSWRPTDRRVARETDRLLATLAGADRDPVAEPFFMGYDAPWTLPFLRRNEVTVEVEGEAVATE
ncbi:SOUL family heme-binding protein [Halomarina ordinaria]|uniref:SOUL family heme-binding protein n=1 Tax=Halomarina ordinaria TaxID=3033939 RepID=A0ABD5U646_9EURY|nr:heme-binding protein [Halomarina sp. PSRA2]